MADRFRTEYKQMSPETSAAILAIKGKANELAELIAAIPPTREVALAFTNLEQSVMWATKALTE